MSDIEAWLADHPNQAHPDDLAAVERTGTPVPDVATCVAVFRGEVLGPFATPREARAALDARIAALEVPLQAGDDGGAVVFVDAAIYHAPQSEDSLNG